MATLLDSTAPLGLVVFSPSFKLDTPVHEHIAINLIDGLWEAGLAGFPIFYGHLRLEHAGSDYYEHLYSRIAWNKAPRSRRRLEEFIYHLRFLRSHGSDDPIYYYRDFIDLALGPEHEKSISYCSLGAPTHS
jgi:hypothetical protein